ncbi:MAG TPA: NBR1-Ig-like domain-containing protein, partial [Symbiobacteriaceae bacterium]|nr:NBR1-Ig-like domain-containing protein [Symbiobacteriaceae bacterium]
MARSRARNRRYTASDGSAAAALPPRPGADEQRAAEEGWQRPWVPWAIGVGLLLAGAVIGWILPSVVLRPILGEMAPTGKKNERGRAEAKAVVGAAFAYAAPGEQVELTWQIRNTGEETWTSGEYFFLPVSRQGARVINLPEPVDPDEDEPDGIEPGELLRLSALVQASPDAGTWRLAWELHGPDGPVPGGRLTAEIRVSAELRPPGVISPEPGTPIPFPPAEPAKLP